MQIIHSVLIGLENTLLNQFGDIPPATMSILEDLHSKGIVLGLCSQRDARWVLHFLERKRIDRIFSYVLAAEGSQYVSLPEKKIISLHAFNPKEARELLTSLSTLESDLSLKIPCARIIDSGRRYLCHHPGTYAFLFALREHLYPVRSVDFNTLKSESSYHRLLLISSKALINRIRRKKELEAYPVCRVFPTVLEIYPRGSSLCEAFALAQKEFHFSAEQTLCFGSLSVEKALLKETFGIAMKNSPKSVIDVCRRTTKYNAGQNGIAYMINVLLMEKACVFRKPNGKAR